MRILYINNDGGGFADHVEIQPGTTVTEFFSQRLPDREPADFLIRVNRQPVPADQVLQVGDRLTITPVKIEGAFLDPHIDDTSLAEFRDTSSKNLERKAQRWPGNVS
jgi:hypothetical protein